MYKYKLYALRSDLKESAKIIYRKNEITEKRKEKISGNFADYIADKYNVQVVLYGCNKV